MERYAESAESLLARQDEMLRKIVVAARRPDHMPGQTEGENEQASSPSPMKQPG